MAEIRSQFFNGKTYSANDFVESNKNTMSDGILSDTEYFKTIPVSNMDVAVTAGRGWVQGHAFSDDSTLVFTLDNADGTLDRVDSIVIRLDLTTDYEKIECKVIKGILGGTAPLPIRDGTYYDLVIANISVGHGVTAITPNMIYDKRGVSELCGWSGTWLCDPDNFFQLFTTGFTSNWNSWFSSLKDQLNGNQAANLQLQIDDLISSTTEHRLGGF